MVGGARAVARCDALGVAPYSDMAGGLYRGYLTPAYAEAQRAVAGWMVEAGMRVTLDPAANLVGRYDGTDDGPALIIASHLDSVRDGGRYDGPLGILLGVECVAALHAAGRRMPFPIEVYAFGDEEGSRFPAAMLTSRAVAGTLDPAMLDVADADGVGLAEALSAFTRSAHAERGRGIANAGTGPSTALGASGRYLDARHPPARAYLEAHIEQGPVLESEGLALGVVTGIAAQLRYRVTVTGTAGHAGTTSMALRRDALTAAAEMVLAVERIALAKPGVVATVGRLEAAPGAANVIPGVVVFSIDIRAGDATVRDEAAEDIHDEIAVVAGRRAVDFRVERVHDLPASPCDPALADLLADAVGPDARRLVSGAGHDAMAMAALCPTAMLFIRCRGGISHNPAEHVEPADAEAALAAMLGFIERLGVTSLD